MEIEKTVHEMLRLGKEWEVSSCEYEQEAKTFFIVIKETSALWETERCAKEGGELFCYDHVEPMRWKHLNIFNQRCELVCALPRGKCRVCGKVSRITPPWEGKNKHFTKDFETFALTLMREMPVKRVGEIIQVDEGRLWRMLLAHVDAAYEKLGMEEVTVVGADEMNRRKGHNYLTVFCDLVAKRVLFATPGKDAGVWKDFADELVKHNGHPHAVTQVSIDMSAAYRRGVEDNLRNAKMVFDKFHVIQHCGEAVDAVRRLESNLDSGRKNQLKKTRWIWLKNPENLTAGQKQRLSRIDRDCLWTAKAYQMRLGLQNIYQMPRGLAKKRFASWCRWVKKQAAKAPHSLLDTMVKVAEMVERHLEGILEHWTAGITNAFLEGLNSLFSATKRKARGYRTTRYFIAMLYFVAAKLNIPSLLNPLFH